MPVNKKKSRPRDWHHEGGIEPQKGKKIDPEFAQMLEEWFFSGNWI